jgi:hypothetical protein
MARLMADRGHLADGTQRWYRVHLLHRSVVVHQARLHDGGGGLGGDMVLLVPTSGVGIAVNAGVTGEFVRSAETLRAAGELAGVRLLAGMCSNVSGLML